MGLRMRFRARLLLRSRVGLGTRQRFRSRVRLRLGRRTRFLDGAPGEAAGCACGCDCGAADESQVSAAVQDEPAAAAEPDAEFGLATVPGWALPALPLVLPLTSPGCAFALPLALPLTSPGRAFALPLALATDGGGL